MKLSIVKGEVLRLEQARGWTVCVTQGRVWITEAGVLSDVFLDAGQSHCIDTMGLTLVGVEASGGDGQGARLEVCAAARSRFSGGGK